eukprot:PITA_34125
MSVYYVSFIDEFSRSTWIYFLKKKSKVFDKFKEFKAPVENQTKKKIKVLRIDNGGEFCSKEFEDLCRKCGIAWHKTTPNTPKKNGVAKRMDKKLMERERSMLNGVGLGYEFWAEAVEKTWYLINGSPSLVLEDKTPQEGYKLWNPITRKVVYNLDVVFREVKDVIKHEVHPKEPKKIEFELKEEESDSTEEEESEDEEPQNPCVRRLVRERSQPKRYTPSTFCSNFSLSITNVDPRTMKEAADSEDIKLWKEAMVDEMASLHKNEAWDLVELTARRKPIGRKWVSKKKTNAEGKVEKYKARLVAKGYSQVPRIDFGDIFSLVANVTSIRLLLYVAATFDLR